MSDCVFCKIVAGEIPSVKIRENDQFIALLDAFPACKGQTLVLPKRHYDPDIFLMENNVYVQFMLATKEVVSLLKHGLGVDKIGLVVEGLQVPHAHIKLYPFRGGKSFEGRFTGHTLADMNELQTLAHVLKS
ncbi:MAG: HIT domain-containing protein [candidate division SR1 bacterium]|nr:HIT domain-containing protein [candidate division SR1 bacterium]